MDVKFLRLAEKNGGGRELLFGRGKARAGEVRIVVEKIAEAVQARGDGAVLGFCEKFDGVKLDSSELKVSQEEFREAMSVVPEKISDALKKSAENIRKFAALEMRQSWFAALENGRVGKRAAKPPKGGGFVGKVFLPIGSVGVYAPGGKASYPSSVLMGVIPAKVAGVENVFVCSPPGKNGKCNPLVLVAARIAGADGVFKIGGAQAIAALAFGTKTVPKVDKIVGPGNVFVNEAKKFLAGQGVVAIDLPAGPSEILVVADETCNPAWVASDLLAQAEHDENACAVLVALGESVAVAVGRELEEQLDELKRREIAQKSLEKNGAIVVARNLGEAMRFANDFAPEHLELCVKNPLRALSKVRNAGAVFLGNCSCEAVGDYAAGPNHVLPTGGAAKAFSGLGAKDFLKETSVEFFSRKDLQGRLGKISATLAQAEGLQGHARAIAKRRGK